LVRHKEQKRFKNRVLEELVDALRLGLDDDVWPSLGHWLTLLRRAEEALAYNGPAYAGGYEELFETVEKGRK